VTATATEAEKLRELDEDMRRAWADYADVLRELRGAEYDAAEDESWEKLQAQLTRLERRRKRLAAERA
jgi:hypothetical protein